MAGAGVKPGLKRPTEKMKSLEHIQLFSPNPDIQGVTEEQLRLRILNIVKGCNNRQKTGETEK